MKVNAISQHDYARLKTQRMSLQRTNLENTNLSDTFVKQNNQTSFKGAGGGVFGACVGSFLAMGAVMVLAPAAATLLMVGAHCLGVAAGGYAGHKIEEKAEELF